MASRVEDILYLSRKDVELACRTVDSVEVMRGVFRLHGLGETILPSEAYLGWTNPLGESVRSLNMPGYVGGTFDIAGTKIINSNPANPKRGVPRASGLTLLYDSTSTRIVCVMEGAYLSSLRTASVTALAADLLKGINIERLAVIGAGALARAHIDLLASTLSDLSEILVFDLERERTAALQREVAPALERGRITLTPVASAEVAIKQSQLIVSATTTTKGYICFDWLPVGALLVNVSLDDPLPEVVLRADKVIVDDWSLVSADNRRLIGRMYRGGQIVGPDAPDDTTNGRRRIDAELSDLVTGRKEGRSNLSEVILVNPFGLSIEDVALAANVYRVARDEGLGTFLSR
jgi:ornithine cyclodeaminase/alanine dehydrogenase-like protein (mu-crystallin family)